MGVRCDPGRAVPLGSRRRGRLGPVLVHRSDAGGGTMTRSSWLWLAQVLATFALGVLATFSTLLALFAVARSY